MMAAMRRFTRARVIPTVGSPGTIDSDKALEVFWGDYHMWNDVRRIPGNEGLKAPRIQVWGAKGLVVEVDGAEHPFKCPECAWPMRRDESLDEPIEDLDGIWQGHRCVADPAHTHLEPID